MVRNRLGESCARWDRLLARIETDPAVRELPDPVRRRFLGGALYGRGVLEPWRDGPKVLDIADQLDASGVSIYRVSANQIRTVYYAHQGNTALFEHYRDQAERYAIQEGTAHQLELWEP